MLYSMTGYGEAFYDDERIRVGFRFKGVNNRGLDLKIKLPGDLLYLESKIRAYLTDHLFRGRVDVFSEIEIRDLNALPQISLDKAQLAQIIALSEQMKAHEQVTGSLDVNTLIRLPDLISTQSVGFRLPEALETILMDTLAKACERFLEGRREEGKGLEADILQRIQNVRAKTDEVEAVAENRRELLIAQIRERVTLLLDDVGLDESRLYQEAVYYADRLDVTEEITRLKVHADKTLRLVNSNKRPLGKKLEFLLQELGREVTTIGNKAKLQEIADIVLELKTELEKVREQVLNIE